MLVLPLNNPVGVGSFGSSHMRLFALVMKELAANTLGELFDVMRWSIQAVWEGLWSEHDRHDHKLPPNHRKSGTLAGGYFGIVVQSLGDWKFLKEVYKLSHSYAAQLCCHLCVGFKTHWCW